MSWFYDLKKKQYFWFEAKIGAVAFLANIVTALIFLLLASFLTIIGLTTGALNIISGNANVSTLEIAGLGLIGFGLMLIFLYISFIIRGIIMQKLFPAFKVKL